MAERRDQYGQEQYGREPYGREQYGQPQYGREQSGREQYAREPYAADGLPQQQRRRQTTAVKKGKSAGVVVARVAVSLVGVAALSVSGLSWYVHDQLTSGLTTSNALSVVARNAPPKLDNSVNLLLMGLDSRKDQNGNDLPKAFVENELHAGSSDIGGYNTNTLILIHIPANGGKAQAFSVPRDDYVQTLNGDGSSQGYHKIKEAYGLAKAAADAGLRAQGLTGAALEARGREIGREATLATVQSFLGVHIDHFAEVNLLGFYDIAQVVAPIKVCLNAATSDPNMNGQGSGANFSAGINTLNAVQALEFVRQRHNLTNGDLDRTHRQQAFISSVEFKLKQDGVFSDLTKMQALLDVVKKDVVLDNQWNIIDFAQQAPELTSGNLVFNTLPIQGFATRNGESVNLVNPTQIKNIMQILTGHDPAPTTSSAAATTSSAPAAASHAVVDVYNGSGVTHGAANESKALVAMGYTAGAVGSHTSVSHTEVRYGNGSAGAGQQIAGTLGATAVASSAVAAGHVEVILGAGFTLPGGSGSSGTASTTGGAASPTPSIPFQGKAVQAGGIPCVN